MPELPEVETVVRGLREPLLGRTFTSAWLDWPRCLVTPAPEAFRTALPGQTVRRMERRGKYILIGLDAATLIVHLKMTGRLYVALAGAEHEADRWVHFRFGLDDGRELRFSDARKFGRVYLVPDPAEIVGALGPEPLAEEFDLAAFQARLAGRGGQLKPLLLNQGFVAGIGNIYADEALHRARLHPLRAASSLSSDEQRRLYEGIRAALADGIHRQGASIQWYRQPDGTPGSAQDHFAVYGRTGEPCLHCGTPVERIVVGQRATHYCPACQRR